MPSSQLRPLIHLMGFWAHWQKVLHSRPINVCSVKIKKEAWKRLSCVSWWKMQHTSTCRLNLWTLKAFETCDTVRGDTWCTMGCSNQFGPIVHLKGLIDYCWLDRGHCLFVVNTFTVIVLTWLFLLSCCISTQKQPASLVSWGYWSLEEKSCLAKGLESFP